MCTFITSFLVFKQPHKVQNYGSHFRGGAPETQRVKVCGSQKGEWKCRNAESEVSARPCIPAVGTCGGSCRLSEEEQSSARAQSFLYQPFQRSNTENLFDEPALVYQPIRKGQSWLAEDKAPGKTLYFSPGSRSVSF